MKFNKDDFKEDAEAIIYGAVHGGIQLGKYEIEEHHRTILADETLKLFEKELFDLLERVVCSED